MAKDKWDKADIIAKALIGVFGILATVTIGFNQLQAQRMGANRSLEDSLRDEFLQNYQFAREDATDCKKFNTSLDLASVVAQQLAAPPYKNGRFARSVQLLRAVGPACSEVGGHSAPDVGVGNTNSGIGFGNSGSIRIGGSNTSSFQRKEGSADSKISFNENSWFAVVGSFAVSPTGLNRAHAWAAVVSTKTDLCTEIWKTRISNNYAVVLDGESVQNRAIELAEIARRANVPPDAFTQVGRGWSKLERQCPAASVR